MPSVPIIPQAFDLPMNGRYIHAQLHIHQYKKSSDIHLKIADLLIPSVLQTLTGNWAAHKKK